MAACKGGRGDPTPERFLVAPSGDDQPLLAAVGGPEQLEALETVLTVYGAGAGGEALRQLVPGVVGHGDGVDLDNCHVPDLIRSERRKLVGRIPRTIRTDGGHRRLA